MPILRFWSLVLALLLVFSGVAINAKPSLKTGTEQQQSVQAKPAGTKILLDAKAEPRNDAPPVDVTPIDLVRQPDAYLNKKVTFKATFNSFASLGLDYKKAFRDSKDYVSLLVLRPDVSPKYRIPLSELKLFFPRKKSDVVLHLDAGDTIEVSGLVFSNALGEPWMDIDQLTIVTKAPGKTDGIKKADMSTTP